MKMKTTLKLVLLIGLSLMFFGCITQFSPTDDTITLVDGGSQVFTAKSDIATATLVWELDGQQVATGGTYTLEAENPGPANLTQTLTVSEKGGNPLLRHDTVSWSITVQPPQGPQDLDNDGYTDDVDCNDNDPAIHPGAVEICNELDDNCNGQVDEGLDCSGVPAVPGNVQASDLDAGLTDIHVTWDAASGADYYEVYRAIFDTNGEYKRVASNVAGTAFDYVQTWQADVYAIIGDTPGIAADANDAAKLTFINSLNAFREMALPSLFNFKAPAFFKVKACNENGCSALSNADAGRANYIHTAQFSEVAQHVIPTWGYAQLIALADSPSGANGLSWCGIDLCGSGGGLAMGRVAYVAGEGVMVDVVYEDFTETLVGVPGSYALVSGSLGGANELLAAQAGELFLTGNFSLDMAGIAIQLGMYAHIGGTNGEPSEGYANITYNGATYQFTLPIQPVDGISGHATAPPSPIIPARTDTGDWRASSGSYPVPLSVVPPSSRCKRNWTSYTIPECPVSIAP